MHQAVLPNNSWEEILKFDHVERWRPTNGNAAHKFFWEVSNYGCFVWKSKQMALWYTFNERGIVHLSNELLLPWMRDHEARQAKNQFCPENKQPPGT